MSSGCCIDRDDIWLEWEEDEAIIHFSDSALQELGWHVGDELLFDELDDGSMLITRYQGND